MLNKKLILASGSPRRKELLELLGVPFTVVKSDYPEDEYIGNGSPVEYAQSLASSKTVAVAEEHTGAVVIGADTIVVLGVRIFSKPIDAVEAKQFLRALSGQTHSVITSVAISVDGELITFSNDTKVTFYELEDDLIDMSVATGDPLDKAGAYGIQSSGALFVEQINGDYYSVMGLPIATLTKKLLELEILSVVGGAVENDS
ncbi:Maf family protein [Sporosarcina sp. FA9]|uniref:Maf family protein n=1 Tax=Sporosarcina sp. FA9 TaxID=3413030 RepID=UPI003F654DED